MAAIDWTEIQKKYPGQWVALKDDEETVVGYGKTAREAMEKAAENDYPEAYLTFMPAEIHAYIGGFC